IEKALEQGLELAMSSKSADELAAEVAQLEKLKEQLEKAAEQQQHAVDAATDKPQVAGQHEKQVAETLARTDELGEFSSAIESKLDDGKQRVADAQKQIADIAPASAPARQTAATDALPA